MDPYYSDDLVTLHLGDCRAVLPALPSASVDAVVTDPPYELSFMGRQWDASGIAYDVTVWRECLRVLKPGGHLLAFGATRTYHRLACAVEDAGFEIRDSLHWLYGSGFPKSLDASKAIDRRRQDDILHVTAYLRQARGDRPLKEIVRHLGFAGTEGTHGVAAFFADDPRKARVPSRAQWSLLKELLGFGDFLDAEVERLNGRKGHGSDEWQSRPPAAYEGRPGMAQSWRDGKGWTASDARGGQSVRPEAADWEGWGTALKPAHEPIVMARKPLEGTVAANVLEHGTGALNINGCRVAHGDDLSRYERSATSGFKPGGVYGDGAPALTPAHDAGRWPPNVLLSHAEGCEPSGTRQVRSSEGVVVRRSGADGTGNTSAAYGAESRRAGDVRRRYGLETVEAWDCAEGCPVAEVDRQSGVTRSSGGSGTRSGRLGYHGASGRSLGQNAGGLGDEGGASRFFPVFRYEAKAPASERPRLEDGTAWPTVKPLALMRWLVRLVTPPGGTVLDPFAGTGTTGQACRLEGFRCVLAERDETAARLAVRRLGKPEGALL